MRNSSASFAHERQTGADRRVKENEGVGETADLREWSMPSVCRCTPMHALRWLDEMGGERSQ